MEQKSIQESDVTATLAFTQKIIEESGERLTGSAGAKKAADAIKTEFESYCDSVEMEEFSLSPNAFLGYIRLLVSLYVASTLFIWLNLPFLAVLCIALGIVTMIMEFFLYKEFKIIDNRYG